MLSLMFLIEEWYGKEFVCKNGSPSNQSSTPICGFQGTFFKILIMS